MSVLFPAADAAALVDGVAVAGAEYLLVAALDLEDGSGRRAFAAVGADPDDFRAAVRAQHADALRGVGIDPASDEIIDQHLPEPAASIGVVKSAPSAHKMFRTVVKKVRKDRSQLYSAYFVLVATESQYGTTIRTIRHMGIEPGSLAEAARVEIRHLNRNGQE